MAYGDPTNGRNRHQLPLAQGVSNSLQPHVLSRALMPHSYLFLWGGKPPFGCDHHIIQTTACFALLPTLIGDTQPTLQRVDETIPELSYDQWIVTHQDDRNFTEVRRVIDRMCNVLQP